MGRLSMSGMRLSIINMSWKVCGKKGRFLLKHLMRFRMTGSRLFYQCVPLGVNKPGTRDGRDSVNFPIAGQAAR